MSYGSDGADVLDVLLKLSNLQGFVAGTREAAAGVRDIGVAAEETSGKSQIASSKMSGVAGLASKAFRGTAVAAGVFAYQSVKMANTFDQQMEMIHTQAGATQIEVGNMSKAILGMAGSGQYAQGPVKLAEGLYHLESIGLRGARALTALKVASQGAAVGNADLEDTTTALGSAWLVNIKGGGDLKQVMATLNATVGAGNMRMGDLVNSLGTGVLAAGKLAGLSLNDVMGALATLSDEGYRGSSAMAQLATSFHFLTDPTAKAKKALGELGLSQFQLSDTMRTKGLPATLALLKNRLAGFSPARQEALLGDILPAGRGRVLEVLMNQVDRYGKKIHQIQNTSKNFGEDVAATHKTAAFQIHAAWSSIQSQMIRVGHLLQPIVVELAKGLAWMVKELVALIPWLVKLAPIVAPIVAAFVAYEVAVKGIIIVQAIWEGMSAAFAVASALVAGGTLEMTVAWVALSAALSINPFVLIAVALVAVGVALYMAYKHFKWFHQAVNAVVHAVIAAFKWLGNAIWDVVKFIGQHWKWLLLLMGPFGWVVLALIAHWKWFKKEIAPIINWLVGAFHWALNAIKDVWKTVGPILAFPFKWAWKEVVKPVVNWIVGAFQWAEKEVTKIWNKMMGPIKAVGHWLGGAAHTVGNVGSSIGHFFGLQAGGTIASPGMALVGEHGPELLNLPRAASVIPLRTAGLASPVGMSSSLEITIPVVIDGREIARATGKYIDNRLARQ
ncbi:MAG TPA: phage tail tape measure protein [Scandinavium sp.]|uniref:phage tail tape measure protein n=1 Tax=Scandinavium sp. TaxID=2830653 RepID=UPI002E343789|nr:phage tail tape measure protein [Scandinavium sp.]HEX4501091.1 phage tail tape measure protein [Scandinavium sp.]